MNILKKKIIKITFSSVITICILYAGLLFILPAVLNSHLVRTKVNKTINQKTGLELETRNLKFKVKPDLTLNLTADYIDLNDEKPTHKIISSKDLKITYDIKKLRPEELNISYIYFDAQGLKKLFDRHKNKKASDFKLKFIPKIKADKIEIWIDKQNSGSFFISVYNFLVDRNDNINTIVTFKAEIISGLLQNIIEAGNRGKLYINEQGLFADNFELSFGLNSLFINGQVFDNKNKSNCTIEGENLPVNDIQQALLFFLKLRNPGKQFIENFYDFDGLLNVDLVARKDGLYGRCKANNLSAKSVLFNVPIIFKEVYFNFNNREVTSAATGTIGGEKVINVFALTGMATDNQRVKGHINSVITDKLADKYIPKLTIIGGADTTVDYSVKNKIVNVDYLLKLRKNSDLKYEDAYFGRTDFEREIIVNTTKEPDKLTLTHFEYSDIINGKSEKKLTGNGLFIKENEKLTPSYICAKTNGYLPVTVAGSFGRHIDGGFFNGDLKYDFKTQIVTGKFNIKDTTYKNFFVSEANVNADEKITNIKAEGTFKNSPFYGNLSAKSNFINDIYVYDMNMHLNNYMITPNSKSTKPDKTAVEKIKREAKELALTIDKWNITIDNIKRDRIKLQNVVLSGNVKNNVFKFIMPPIKFAEGTLNAKGFYNLNNENSEIDFEANNINSDKVATVVFNFPGQIEGIANAKVKAVTSNGYKDMKAVTDFKIKDGFLTKIGSTEFIVKKSKKLKRDIKFRLEDFVYIDVRYMDALKSDLCGRFYYDNGRIYDAEITSQQKYFSFILKGDYDIDSMYADLILFGKYNSNVSKTVKVFYIPLSWITKLFVRPEKTYEKYKKELDEIPSINATPEETKFFRLKINGKMHAKDVKFEMKSII